MLIGGNMVHLAKPGDFCQDAKCPDYQKLQNASQRNIIKAGKTKAGVQRYECTTCHHTFTATKGTLFYGKRTPAEKILETLAFLAEGSRVSSLTRVKGVKEDTILNWLREAAQHTDALNEVLLKDFKVKRGQLDGLWLFVHNKDKKKSVGQPASRRQP
jgi:transposase-like protein